MNIQGVLNIHRKDRWGWLFIPSIILSSSFLINLIVSLLINNEEPFYTGGVSSIFIYVLVLGILVVTQSFPFAIGMSVTRKAYFCGTALMGLIASFIIGTLLCILSFLENLTNGWGNRFHFFHFPYLNDGSFLEQLVMYIILFTYLFFVGFLIASFARRFGGKGMLLLILAFLLISSISVILLHQFQAWSHIFQWFLSQTAVELSYWLLPSILISTVLSFLLLRRASI
ncbi:hypothetical protein [Bacillus norwichensis]|uniref:ABC transporter permease n=1 Tax=Bacillus norwichensis TaxID=2762217 RepID=A0ABR8VI92_9BACI|nr:hypothetical protein [Bacillus norwichensis]MBD8004498.1 hypothetical protein [Bacillus norwichensis]